jgi:DNA polymerase III gamma/tau subunit
LETLWHKFDADQKDGNKRCELVGFVTNLLCCSKMLMHEYKFLDNDEAKFLYYIDAHGAELAVDDQTHKIIQPDIQVLRSALTGGSRIEKEPFHERLLKIRDTLVKFEKSLVFSKMTGQSLAEQSNVPVPPTSELTVDVDGAKDAKAVAPPPVAAAAAAPAAPSPLRTAEAATEKLKEADQHLEKAEAELEAMRNAAQAKAAQADAEAEAKAKAAEAEAAKANAEAEAAKAEAEAAKAEAEAANAEAVKAKAARAAEARAKAAREASSAPSPPPSAPLPPPSPPSPTRMPPSRTPPRTPEKPASERGSWTK